MTLLLLLVLACATTELYQVDIEGEVSAVQDGPVAISFHFAWWGDGELATPLYAIDSLDIAGPGGFAHTLDYPSAEGEGLVVYAWQDLDGDGELCAPGAADEPAGLVELADFPSHELYVELTLDTPCEGPEGMFP